VFYEIIIIITSGYENSQRSIEWVLKEIVRNRRFKVGSLTSTSICWDPWVWVTTLQPIRIDILRPTFPGPMNLTFIPAGSLLEIRRGPHPTLVFTCIPQYLITLNREKLFFKKKGSHVLSTSTLIIFFFKMLIFLLIFFVKEHKEYFGLFKNYIYIYIYNVESSKTILVPSKMTKLKI
jgi:hypothetical protein